MVNAQLKIYAKEEITITKQGMDFRFKETAVKLLEEMYHEAFKLFKNSLLIDGQILKCFNGVKILDSSYITLPNCMEKNYKGYSSSYPNQINKSKSGIKIQLLFDYLRQNLTRVDMKPGVSADQGYKDYLANIQTGDLLIADLGYFVPSSLQKVMAINAYFISRYKTDTNLYDIKTGKKIELINLIKGSCFFEKEVLLGKETKLRVKIIGHKLSKEQSAVRKRKANRQAKSHGYRSSKRNQNLLEWSLFVTNIPKELVNSEQLFTLYKVRWQIELLFKLYKTHIEIDQFRSQIKSSRVLCEFFAKLIAIVIFHGIANCIQLQKTSELSLPKAMINFKKRARELLNVVNGRNIKKIILFIRWMLNSWAIFALKDPCRKKRLSTLQLINSFDAAKPLT